MRITSQGLPDTSGISAGPAPVQESTRVEAPPTATVQTAASPAMQSATLTPAMQALAALPEIDQAKVAAIRDALAKGEIRFDAGKLAGLINRYHGSSGPHGSQGGQS